MHPDLTPFIGKEVRALVWSKLAGKETWQRATLVAYRAVNGMVKWDSATVTMIEGDFSGQTFERYGNQIRPRLDKS